MAFKRAGTPAKIELLESNRVDHVICSKCGTVLLRAASGAVLTVGEGNMLVTCKCGETTHV